MIDFTCGECNTAMRADEEDGGKTTMCPECGARTAILSAGRKIALQLRGPLSQCLFGCGALTTIAAIIGTLVAIVFAFNGNTDVIGLLCLCILSIGMGLSFIALAYILTYLRYLVNKASN